MTTKKEVGVTAGTPTPKVLPKNYSYIGLDTATVMEVAVWCPDTHIATVVQNKGTPVEQLFFINQYVFGYLEDGADNEFVMEKQHYFRNADTIRSLMERYGSLKWTLQSIGFTVNEISPDIARKFLGTKEKEDTFALFTKYFTGSMMTNNHSDALAVAIYQSTLDGYKFNINRLKIVGKD